MTAAYNKSGRSLEPRSFLRVLNLFYLCDNDLRSAKAHLKTSQATPVCTYEDYPYPWAWYAWGGPDKALDALKVRFAATDAVHHFFYCGEQRKVMQRAPNLGEKARHTQGMPTEDLVNFLARLVSRM